MPLLPPTTETYGNTLPGNTGIKLKWTSFILDGNPPAPAVLVLHPGGFKSGAAGPVPVCQDLAEAGFWALATEYRLAPPHAEMNRPPHQSPGQNDLGDEGHWPEQTNDIQTAIRKARSDSRCNGQVYIAGGSAGASHAMYWAARGTPGDDMPDRIVCCSIGVFALNDPNVLSLPNPGDETDPFGACLNYIPGPVDPADLVARNFTPYLAQLTSASPSNYIHFPGMCPMLIAVCDHDSRGIPTSTGIHLTSYDKLGNPGIDETAVSNGAIPKLLAAGYTESAQAYPEVSKFKKTVVAIPTVLGSQTGHAHAFQYWDLDYSTPAHFGPSVVIPWLLADVGSGGISDPPPLPSIVTGAVVGTPFQEDGIKQAVLDDPNVDGVGVTVPWSRFETAANVFDYSYIDAQIQRAAAAGKRVNLRVPQMGGSAANSNGNTPNYVFTDIGNTPAGFPGEKTDAVITNGSPTVTSATGDFNDADLFKPITGPGIPASTYVGVINSATSIGLSSSNTVNTPVNATGTTNPAVIHLTSRPRVAFNNHDTVPGVTYDYRDANPNHGGDPRTTIPVFWEPTYLLRYKRMLNTLGDHLTNGSTLTQAEKAAVSVVGVAYANAQTDDWNVPADQVIDSDDGKTLTHLDLWLNSATDPVYANRGASYTTQKMIDAACKRADTSITAATTNGSKHLNLAGPSGSDYFFFADVGKAVIGVGIPLGTTIESWTSLTQVELSNAATATQASVVLIIKGRDTGLFDIAAAAFPGQLITTAIGQNRAALDADAAAAAGDPTPQVFLAKTVQGMVNGKYPARMVSQINSLTAVTIEAPALTDPGWNLLWQIHQTGNYVAGQDLTSCFQDPLYRMNGHSNEDKDHPGVFLSDEEIFDRAAVKLFTYGASYREVYERDAVSMPGGIKFLHDLFTGIVVEPPPPPPPGPRPPFHAPMRATPLLELLETIAGLLGIDPEIDLSPSIARTWVSAINRHLRFAWEFWPWPEFYVTEERAYRAIWNGGDQYKAGTELFELSTFAYYLVTLGPDGTQPPVGTQVTNTDYFTPITLADRYVELDQRCRQAIGQLMAVFSYNPYTINPNDWGDCNPRCLPFNMSERGVEVTGSGGLTVFLHYKLRPFRYSAVAWDPLKTYKAGELVYGSDGETHRAILENTGQDPVAETTAAGVWALVPVPYVLSDWVANMVAADMAESLSLKKGFRDDALTLLVRETDKTIEEDSTQRIRYRLFGESRDKWALPCLATVTTAGATLTTLTEQCVNAYGENI